MPNPPHILEFRNICLLIGTPSTGPAFSSPEGHIKIELSYPRISIMWPVASSGLDHFTEDYGLHRGAKRFDYDTKCPVTIRNPHLPAHPKPDRTQIFHFVYLYDADIFHGVCQDPSQKDTETSQDQGGFTALVHSESSIKIGIKVEYAFFGLHAPRTQEKFIEIYRSNISANAITPNTGPKIKQIRAANNGMVALFVLKPNFTGTAAEFWNPKLKNIQEHCNFEKLRFRNVPGLIVPPDVTMPALDVKGTEFAHNIPICRYMEAKDTVSSTVPNSKLAPPAAGYSFREANNVPDRHYKNKTLSSGKKRRTEDLGDLFSRQSADPSKRNKDHSSERGRFNDRPESDVPSSTRRARRRDHRAETRPPRRRRNLSPRPRRTPSPRPRRTPSPNQSQGSYSFGRGNRTPFTPQLPALMMLPMMQFPPTPFFPSGAGFNRSRYSPRMTHPRNPNGPSSRWIFHPD
ncbi:hypothetical protein TWF694_010187 [Orbilia ellipsospora]|uniref:Uncharacterized protein n=1 Tax=Orbilia ellipsospora TaxID=2528407 RepID=A0AAV9XA30_9PEZI